MRAFLKQSPRKQIYDRDTTQIYNNVPEGHDALERMHQHVTWREREREKETCVYVYYQCVHVSD